MIPITIKLSNPRSMPIRAHDTDAGADLVSTVSTTIMPGNMCMIDTGVSIIIPKNFVGLIYNRSSQGKQRIQIANSVGVIDSGYRANIKVLLVNNGHTPYEIEEYVTRVAQLVITPILIAQFHVYNGKEDQWINTARGTGGFGSTGV